MMEIIYYPSANGLHNIRSVIWEPEGEAEGILQISHGMGEYAERYSPLAKFLNEKGFIVCANDHAGHGESVDGLYGFMGERDGYKNMTEDMRSLYDKMRSRYGGLPYFLLGHSMGSFLARYYAAQYPIGLDGLLLSGTGGNSPVNYFGVLLCRLLIIMGKGRSPAKLLSSISGKMFNAKIKNRVSKADWISRDRTIVEEFAANPKSNFAFTYYGYADVFGMLIQVNKKSWAKSLDNKLPIYLFSGDADPVGDYGKGVRAVYESLRLAGCEDVCLKMYKDGRHESLNEVNRAEVMDDLFVWIEKRKE